MSQDDRRERQIAFYADGNLKAVIKDAARQEGHGNMSAWMRAVVIDALKSRGLWPQEVSRGG